MPLEKRSTLEAVIRFDQHDNAFAEVRETEIVYDTETNNVLASNPSTTRPATAEELAKLLSGKTASALAQLNEARAKIAALVDEKAAAEGQTRLREETIAAMERAAEKATEEAEATMEAEKARYAELEAALKAEREKVAQIVALARGA